MKTCPHCNGTGLVPDLAPTEPIKISNAKVSDKSFVSPEYSSVSPFSEKNKWLLLVHRDIFGLYTGEGAFVRHLPAMIQASSEPRWSRRSPDWLSFLRGNQIWAYNCETGEHFEAHTFNQYAKLSGRGEGDMGPDDKLVLAGDGEIFVFDIPAKTASRPLDVRERPAFDSIYMTPGGNVLVSWVEPGEGRFQGIELYDQDMFFMRKVTRAGGHMDVTRDGSFESLIWCNSADPDPVAQNAAVKIRLLTGEQIPLVSFDWSLAMNISCPDGNGWCYVSTYAPLSKAAVPFKDEILQVKLDGSETRTVAPHGSTGTASYLNQPRGAVSRDGRKLVYGSNAGGGTVDTYLIELK